MDSRPVAHTLLHRESIVSSSIWSPPMGLVEVPISGKLARASNFQVTDCFSVESASSTVMALAQVLALLIFFKLNLSPIYW